MPSLPPSSDFNGSTITEAQAKAFIATLRDYLSGMLGTDGTLSTALATLGATLSGYAAKTTTTALVVGDRGKLIDATTGTWTMTLPTIAATGAGWSVTVRNSGTGTITLAVPDAATFDGAATLLLYPGMSVFLVCNGTIWTAVRAPNANVTQTAIDTTAGRLMKVGDAGWLAGATPVSSALNSATVSGTYTYSGLDANSPSGAVGGAILVIRHGGNWIIQQAHTANTWGHYTRTSSDNGATWSAWRQIYNRSNILGTVSQTSGVPTGGVGERGAGANGNYERRFTGWQDCTRTDQTTATVNTADGAFWESADVTWTFPAAFLAATVPVLSVAANNADVVGFRIISISNTAVTFKLRSRASIGSTVTIYAAAKGRWSTLT